MYELYIWWINLFSILVSTPVLSLVCCPTVLTFFVFSVISVVFVWLVFLFVSLIAARSYSPCIFISSISKPCFLASWFILVLASCLYFNIDDRLPSITLPACIMTLTMDFMILEIKSFLSLHTICYGIISCGKCETFIAKYYLWSRTGYW